MKIKRKLRHIPDRWNCFIQFFLLAVLLSAPQLVYAANKTLNGGESLSLNSDTMWDNLFTNTSADNWAVITGPYDITVTGTADIQYVSFQNTGTITFENETIIKNCVFDGNAAIVIGTTSTPLTTNIIIEDSDFREQTNKIAFSVSSVSGDSVGTYKIKGNTFYYSTRKVVFLKHRNGCIFTENVVYNMEMGNLKDYGYASIGGNHTYSSNFFTSGSDVTDYRTLTVNFRKPAILFDNNYCFYDFGNPHAFTRTGANAVETDRYTNNIVEIIFNDDGANIFNSNMTRPVVISNNILIGSGSLANAVGSDARKAVTLNNNTCYSTKGGNSGDGILYLSEGGVNEGVVDIYNNIVTGSEDPGAAIGSNSTVQAITSSDFNAFYNVSTPYDNVSVGTGLSNDTTTEDPAFIAPARNLFAWDTYKGGAGTKTSVVNSLALMNGYDNATKKQSDSPSGYNPADLITWVRRGFTPTNLALQGTGKNGTDIGAVAVTDGTQFSILIHVPFVTN